MEVVVEDVIWGFVHTLDNARVARGYSVATLGERAGIGKLAWYSNASHARVPLLKRLMAVATALGMDFKLTGRELPDTDGLVADQMVSNVVKSLEDRRKELGASVTTLEKKACLPKGAWYFTQSARHSVTAERIIQVAMCLGCELTLEPLST